jgi:hypothetical protein
MTDEARKIVARSYHGTGEQAIEWALHHSPDCGLEMQVFFTCWQQGDLAERSDFYAWLDAQSETGNG